MGSCSAVIAFVFIVRASEQSHSARSNNTRPRGGEPVNFGLVPVLGRRREDKSLPANVGAQRADRLIVVDTGESS